MSDFDDHPQVPEAFDRLRDDADALDTMAPLAAVRDRAGRTRKLAWGIAGGAVAALLVIVGIAVFGGDEPEDVVAGDGDGRVTSVADLPGSSWELVQGYGPEGEIEIITDYVPTIEFEGDVVAGNAACHRYGAALDLDPESDTTARIAISRDEFQKASECLTEGVSEAESGFNAALDDVTDLALVDGRLELTGPDTRLLFRQITDGAPRPLTETEGDILDVPLRGTTWELVDGVGPTGPIIPAPGARVTLVFGNDDTIGGHTGCNGYGTTIELDGANLAVGTIDGEQEGCDGAIGATEEAYLSALAAVSRIELDGASLLLLGDEVRLRFRPAATEPTEPHLLTQERIAGTAWTLVDSWAPPAGSQPVPIVDGWPITLDFTADTIGGTAACNGYGGRYALDGAAIRFVELSWTEMGCEPDVQDSEQAYLGLLVAVEGGRFDGGRLILSSELGELIFDPVGLDTLAEVVDRTWSLESATSGDETLEADSALYGLRLGSDGTLTAVLACGRLDGEYVSSGAGIVPTTLAFEPTPCAATERPVSDVAFSVVESGFTPTLNGETLTLLAQGAESLTWVPGDMPSGSDEPTGLSLDDLDGTTWRLFEGLVGEVELSGGDDIRLSFAGDIATAGNECNSFRPNVTVVNGAIGWADAVVNVPGCGDGLDTFLEAITDTTTASIFPGVEPRVLELFGPDIQLNFEEVADIPVTLDRSTWRLVDTATLPIDPDGVTIAFEGNEFAGSAHCNDYGGTFTLDGEEFDVVELSATEIGCDRTADEAAYFEALDDAGLLVIDDATGDLIIDVGLDELVYERVTGPGAETGTSTELGVSELLDTRPTETVLLQGQVITYGGTTIVCDKPAEVRDGEPPLCLGRWVTVTNYNSLVDGDGPLTGVLRDDGRFQIIGPGSGVLERGSGVEVTSEDADLVAPLLAFLNSQTDSSEALGALGGRLAPNSALWLGNEFSKEGLSPTDLADPTTWTFDVESFNAWAGPLSALTTLRTAGEAGLTAGHHDHCASQPLLLPESLQRLRQVSIQPEGIDSCLQWFAVDVFLNDDGRIAAVMLDLWEP